MLVRLFEKILKSNGNGPNRITYLECIMKPPIWEGKDQADA